MSRAINDLFGTSEDITKDREILQIVLALAPELEALKGVGSQRAALRFAANLPHVMDLAVAHIQINQHRSDPLLGMFPTSAMEMVACLKMLAAHAFARVQNLKIRTEYAIQSRVLAWESLTVAAEILLRSDHLAQAIKVATNPQATPSERLAVARFLAVYWQDEEPDESSATILNEFHRIL